MKGEGGEGEGGGFDVRLKFINRVRVVSLSLRGSLLPIQVAVLHRCLRAAAILIVLVFVFELCLLVMESLIGD